MIWFTEILGIQYQHWFDLSRYFFLNQHQKQSNKIECRVIGAVNMGPRFTLNYIVLVIWSFSWILSRIFWFCRRMFIAKWISSSSVRSFSDLFWYNLEFCIVFGNHISIIGLKQAVLQQYTAKCYFCMCKTLLFHV